MITAGMTVGREGQKVSEELTSWRWRAKAGARLGQLAGGWIGGRGGL